MLERYFYSGLAITIMIASFAAAAVMMVFAGILRAGVGATQLQPARIRQRRNYRRR